jgi:hypothetical protein
LDGFLWEIHDHLLSFARTDSGRRKLLAQTQCNDRTALLGIISDGMEADYLQLNRDAVATVGLAKMKARLFSADASENVCKIDASIGELGVFGREPSSTN